ncbi:MAG TPA: L-threonylcarbamoyladenylate synthase [Anaerolineae bacterium]|jgi:L-threonylcarbamoyladenylate synthase
MTEILPADSPKSIRRARRLLREGDVVAFPTDTLYGLGANAFERFAVRQIFEIKQRPPDKALPVFIYQIDDLNQVARHVPNRVWSLLPQFWPGALTVVLLKNPKLPDDVTAGQNTVAVRVPDHPVCLDLVIELGRPLAVTSANLSGYASPTTAQEVVEQLGPRLPLILDGGPLTTGLASTIIDLSVDPPRLLRPGPVSLAELRDYLPDLQGDEDHS